MEFIPSSVPDGNIEIQLARLSTSAFKHDFFLAWLRALLNKCFAVPCFCVGTLFVKEIKPFCMGFEDYYAAFTQDSSPVFRIKSGAVGRMDRRGGESTFLEIVCENRGHDGVFEGTIVVNLPDDDSKLTYTVRAATV
jgi:hypothetical protein